MQLDRIVIGMDFSPPAVAAARWVRRHVAPDAELVLVHAIWIPEPPAVLRGRFSAREPLIDTERVGANQRLREVRQSLGSDRVRVEIRVGEPAAQIAEFAGVYGADLIVVGKHGDRPGLWNRLGTTAEGVLRGSTVPVLLATSPRDRRPRHLLAPVDGSAITPRLLSWAGFLGARFDAEATILHVISASVSSAVLGPAQDDADGNAGEAWESARASARSEVERWLAGLEIAGVPHTRAAAESTFGEPGQEILAAARRFDSDLIVLGAHPRRAVRRALFGSVANEVLRGAECPVLAITEPAGEIEDD
jgi:nucleotide-binding universal stress UspA family protein